MINYPKILIYSQPFNNYSGGGITLSNLFKGWPIEFISVIAHPYMLERYSTNICHLYYQIGNEEYLWKFPFNVFKKGFKSGILNVNEQNDDKTSSSNLGLKRKIAKDILNPIVDLFGLSHCNSEIIISPGLSTWLSEFNPDILYLQVSSRESILFSKRIIEYLKIPTVIHMMDDWPSVISIHGLLKKYWSKRIDRELRSLFAVADLHLSISEAMSEEYYRRYQKVFKAFHNPVEFSQNKNTSRQKSSAIGVFRVLYIGRIGTANLNTICLFAYFVSEYKSEKTRVEFSIYSKDSELPELRSIKTLRHVSINPPVKHELIAGLLQEYDLLLLPLDFTDEGIMFSRFSIPTKASEYMLSGTPILVFAPANTAVSKFFSDNNCGCCITKPDECEFKKALNNLINDSEYTNTISKNAYDIAITKFNGQKVRNEFQSLLVALAKGGTIPEE